MAKCKVLTGSAAKGLMKRRELSAIQQLDLHVSLARSVFSITVDMLLKSSQTSIINEIFRWHANVTAI